MAVGEEVRWAERGSGRDVGGGREEGKAEGDSGGARRKAEREGARGGG